MRIDFKDRSYFELTETKDGNKIIIVLGSRQKNNPLELVVNSAEIEKKDFFNAIKNVLGPKILENLNKEKQEYEFTNNIKDSTTTID